MRYKKTYSLLLPLLLLLVGLYLVPLKIYETDFSMVPGDLGDARFNNYILEHGYKFLIGEIHNYWDAPFMYPYSNVIALSDNLLGTVPIYSAFRLLGQDRETSFQLWLLVLFALNFICCWWVLNKWSNNGILAATGAYIFAFSIFILGHITNVQTFPRFIVPFVFYWAWKYLSQKHIKYFLFLTMGIVYQFYCGIYLGFFLIYTLLFLFISYFIIYKDKLFFYQFKKIEVISYHLNVLFLAGILLAPLMFPYINISHKLGMRNFDDAFSSIPLLHSYFFTSEASQVWRWLSKYPPTKEWWLHVLFTGILPWLGIAVVPFVLFFKRIETDKKKLLAFFSLALFLTFIFCLNLSGFTLYKIIFKLPGFSSMRSINRIINTEIMYFIIIFVFVFDHLSKSYKIIKWIVIFFPLLVVIDNLINPAEMSRYGKRDSQQQIELVKKQIKREYNAKYLAVAYMPSKIEGKEIETHLNVMLAAQELNIPCVNAYTGSHPGEYTDFFFKSNDAALNKWCIFNHFDKTFIQEIQIDSIVNNKQTPLMAGNDKYVCADKTLNHILIANRDSAYLWETFTIVFLNDNKCAIRAYDECYLSPEINQQNEITAIRKQIGPQEIFSVVNVGNNCFAFKAVNDKYVCLDEKTLHLYAKSDSIGKNEKFILTIK